ncbi:MAG TPA: hypothetical protein PKZ99_05500, partial [Azospirillaceae bacterium]|nr:hypothetical protein [Azospirillaceae bacterium]
QLPASAAKEADSTPEQHWDFFLGAANIFHFLALWLGKRILFRSRALRTDCYRLIFLTLYSHQEHLNILNLPIK